MKKLSLIFLMFMVSFGCVKTKKTIIPLNETLSGAEDSLTKTAVADAELVSIVVEPDKKTIAKGTKLQYKAVGIYSNNANIDVTANVTWSSGTAEVSPISATGIASGVASGTSEISASLKGVSGKTTLKVVNATLVSLQVTQITNPLPTGSTVELVATGTFKADDGTTFTQDISTQVTWTAQAPSVATVDGSGKVTTDSTGTSPITATYTGDAGTASGSTTATVTSAKLVSITLVPSTTIAAGTGVQYTAIATFDDGTTLDITNMGAWSSSDPSVVAVGDTSGTNKGMTLGYQAGDGKVSVTWNGMTAESSVTVTPATLASIEITPTTATAAIGTTQQFKATGVFSDGSKQDITTQVTWGPTNGNTVGSVSNTTGSKGLASTYSAGTLAVTAAMGTVSASASLTVSGASVTLTGIELVPLDSNSLAKGTTVQYKAIGVYSDGSRQDITNLVSWGSSNTSTLSIGSVVTVSADRSAGLQALNIKGEGTGTANLTATLNGVTASVPVTITPAVVTSIQVTPKTGTGSLAKGTTIEYVATAIYSDGTHADVTSQVSWSTSDNTKASVSNTDGTRGTVTGADVGTASITATYNGISGSSNATVTPATLVRIEVTSAGTGTLYSNNTRDFVATGIYSDGTTQTLTSQVTWASSVEGAATIDNATNYGRATGVATGTTVISASLNGVSSNTSNNSITLTVETATLTGITVSPSTASKAKGLTQQFTATGTYSNGATGVDITNSVNWSSGDSAKVSMDFGGTKGLAKALDVATDVAIIATKDGVTNNTAKMTVSAAEVVSISISAADGKTSIAKGQTLQYTAIATMTDGTTPDVTSSVTWGPTSGSVSVSNSGTNGLATGNSAGGPVNVTASIGGVVSPALPLTVTPAVITSITISTDAGTSIAKGLTKDYVATATFSDLSTQTITNSVTWGSTNTAAVTIDNGTNHGRATGAGVGTTSITAVKDGVTSNALSLEVTAATIVSIAVSPSTASKAKGLTQQFSASATMTDTTTVDITATATWSKPDGNTVVTVDHNGTKGLVKADNVGSAVITATKDGVSNTATMTVTAAEVVSISISPANTSIAKGSTQQYTATATMTDGATPDVTTSVTWTSSNGSVSIGSTGLATGAAEGTATITATLNGISNTASLTVTAAVLNSISVAPTNPTINLGATQSFTATGNYTDGSRDITTSVAWTSSNTGIATIVGNTGVATAVSGGSTTITASLDGKTATATLTVSAGTLTSIQVVPVTVSIPTGTTYQFTAMGTYSSGLTMDITSQVSWSSNATNVLSINNTDSKGLATATTTTGTATVTASLDGQSGASTATVYVDNTSPYMVFAIDITDYSSASKSTILVKFSEDVTLADVKENYTISGATVNSVTKVAEDTYKVETSALLTGGTEYTITGLTNIKDKSNNVLTDPRVLTFVANDPLRLISAEAKTTTTVEAYFSRLLTTPSDLTTSNATCNTEATCKAKYYISGLKVTEASVVDNKVTLTVAGNPNAMKSVAYTLVVANGAADDPTAAPAEFDTGTGDAIKDLGSNNLQGNPKDRMSFMGLGTNVNNFEAGWYMDDPFQDGSYFSFTFNYKGKVYVGPNSQNNTTLRLDANGDNIVSNTYAFTNFSGYANPGTCTGTPGFGMGFQDLSNQSCVSYPATNYTGYHTEQGIVGYTSLSIGNADFLVVGAIRTNIKNSYFTQDMANKQTYKPFQLPSYSGGGNVKSVQTFYAYGNNLYIGLSCDLSTQCPSLLKVNPTISGSDITAISSSTNAYSIPFGNQTTNVTGQGASGNKITNSNDPIGIDSVLGYENVIYVANSGGIVKSADIHTATSANGVNDITNITPTGMNTTGKSTLVLPGQATSGTYPEGLLKVSPGQRGIPFLKVHNGNIYMVRNVSQKDNGVTVSTDAITEANKTPNYGELWKCTVGADKICDQTEWTKVLTSNTDINANARSISMFEITPTGVVYLGFDGSEAANGSSNQGFQIYRKNVGTNSDITAGDAGSWVLQGSAGLDSGDANNKYTHIQSSTVIKDRDNIYYTYITVGRYNTTSLWYKPIKVYRQGDNDITMLVYGGQDKQKSTLLAFINGVKQSTTSKFALLAIFFGVSIYLSFRFRSMKA
jgi:uncharacterized protein YjdB